MPVELRETRLPGVGTKFSIQLDHGNRLAVILHNDGKRELYYFRGDDEDPRAVITLDDDEARQLGAVLGGDLARRADLLDHDVLVFPLDHELDLRGAVPAHEDEPGRPLANPLVLAQAELDPLGAGRVGALAEELLAGVEVLARDLLVDL